MFDNYFFLCRAVKELNDSLQDSLFKDSFSQRRNEIVFEFKNNSRTMFLVFSFASLPPLIDFRHNFAKARKNVAQFFEGWYDSILQQVAIDSFERNIRLIFENFQIVIVYRASQSNCVLVSNSDEMKSSFKKKNELVNKNFKLIFPPSQIDETIFTNKVKFNKYIGSFVKGEKNIYHHILGSQILDEIIARHSQNTDLSYFEYFQNIIYEMNTQNIMEYEDGSFSIGNFISKGKIVQEHLRFFESIRNIYYSRESNKKKERLRESLLKNVSKRIEKLEKKLIQLRSEKNLADQSADFRVKGNLLLQHIGEIKKGSKIIILNDQEKKTVSISLDPSKSIHDNIEAYFSKAKEEKQRIESVYTLIKLSEKESSTNKSLYQKIKSTDDYQFLIDMEKKLSIQKQRDSSLEKIESKFRHFTVFGDFDVFVGKDSISNDLLTTKFAKPNDLWFHVRGASGSHTILKKKEKKKDFPKEAILSAASIAAYYSKAKHSKYVPVAYTEKKFVTKRKKLPTGTVFLQKEKVVIVEPKLPNQIKGGD